MANLIYDNGEETFNIDIEKLKSKLIEEGSTFKDASKVVELHNEWCDDGNYPDDKIYHLGELDEVYSIGSKTPREIIYELSTINLDDWFFNCNYYSFNDPLTATNSPVDLTKLINWLGENERLDELADIYGIDLEDKTLRAEVKKNSPSPLG